MEDTLTLLLVDACDAAWAQVISFPVLLIETEFPRDCYMAVLIAGEDVGCSLFSRPYIHPSLYPGCSLLPAMSTIRQRIHLLSVAARSEQEIL